MTPTEYVSVGTHEFTNQFEIRLTLYNHFKYFYIVKMYLAILR